MEQEQQQQLASLKDLLEAHCSSTPWELGRSLYKYTDCGPWISFTIKEKDAETAQYRAEIRLNPDGDGIVLLHHNDLPDLVVSLLGFNADGNARKEDHPGFTTIETYYDLLVDFTSNHQETGVGRGQEFRIVTFSKESACVLVDVEQDIPEQTRDIYYEDSDARAEDWETTWGSRCIAVKIGSIVEGSDVYVGPEEILFPFSEDDFGKLVESINSEACFYWDRDNSDWFELFKNGKIECVVRNTWGEIVFENGEGTLPKSLVRMVKKGIAEGKYDGDYYDRPLFKINARWSIQRFENDTTY